jgi:hypothetical protein
MTQNNKGRDRLVSGATPKISHNHNPSRIRSGVKVAIVRLALWGVIPANLATWMIQRGGLRDA